MNPFLIGVGLMNLGACIWAFTHESPVLGISLIFYTCGAVAQSFIKS